MAVAAPARAPAAVAVASLLAWLLAAGCATGAAAPAEALIVFAPVSLTEATSALADAYERAPAGGDVVVSLAGTQTLVTQLAAGAPADVLLTADERQMARARAAGLVEAPAAVASNDLVIAVPAGNPAGIRGGVDLGRPGIRLVLAAPEVPAGRYAGQALAALGVAAAAAANVVSHEHDVRAVLGKVAAGEADAGIVYRTDLAVARRVQAVELGVDVAVTYHVAVVRGARSSERAEGFVGFLRGPAGRGLLRAAGLGAPR